MIEIYDNVFVVRSSLYNHFYQTKVDAEKVQNYSEHIGLTIPNDKTYSDAEALLLYVCDYYSNSWEDISELLEMVFPDWRAIEIHNQLDFGIVIILHKDLKIEGV